METRNTLVPREIINVPSSELDDAPFALDQLEDHFQGRLLVDVGNVAMVGAYAVRLRLQVTDDECSTVLDYLAEQKMALVTVNHAEQPSTHCLRTGSSSREVRWERGTGLCAGPSF